MEWQPLSLTTGHGGDFFAKDMHEINSSFNRSGEQYKQVANLLKEYRSLKDRMNRSGERGIREQFPWYYLFYEEMGRSPSVQPVSIEDTTDTSVNSIEVEVQLS